MTIGDYLVRELEIEAQTTRRVLERVPADKLTWKPHEKSMSLGVLALHVASTPGAMAASAIPDSYPVENFKPDPDPVNVQDILKAHEASMATAKAMLAGIDDAKANATWTLTAGGKPMISMPRIDWIRVYTMNHVIHHRGQLSVYLRELNVPVPAMYGPSADESGS
jgi:uncharacterized damage-inducible protein DinB